MKACILFTSDNEVAEDWLGKFDSREPLDIYGQKYLIDEISTDYEPGFAGVTIKMYPAYQAKSPKTPKKQEAWDSEDLPPVGAKCEVDHGGGVFWDIVTIIAHHGEKAIYEDPHGSNKYLWGLAGNFRPIKTSEQVAAEERESAITDIALIFGKDPTRIAIREKAGVLYDSGYRKQ